MKEKKIAIEILRKKLDKAVIKWEEEGASYIECPVEGFHCSYGICWSCGKESEDGLVHPSDCSSCDEGFYVPFCPACPLYTKVLQLAEEEEKE